MRQTALFFLFLSACGPWPDVGPETPSRGENWPQLLPLSQIVTAGTVAVAEEDDAIRLAARAQALRARARILRANARNIDEMEDLRARLP